MKDNQILQQEHNSLTKSQNEKVVSIPVKELLTWEKKSKEQQSQIKALQNEAQLLKSQLEEQQKIQNSKQVKSSLSLEGMIQKCTVLQQMVDDTSSQNSKLTSEINLLKQLNDQLKEDYNVIQIELKDLRLIAQDKFKIEGELQQAQLKISENKDQQQQIDLLISNYENCQEMLETTKKTLKQSEQLRMNSQQKKEEIESQFLKIQQQLQENELTNQLQIQKLRDLEHFLSQKLIEYEELEKKYREQCILNEDMNNQLKIIQKKFINDSEQIKDECVQKQIQINKLLEENEQLKNDLKNIREIQFRLKVQDTPLSKKEKIVVESLSLRVQELELENKITREQFGSKIIELKKELDQKIAYINKLAQMISHNYPSFLDVDNIDQQNIQMIKELLQKPTIQNILEKTLIENLELRESISILGAELNKRQ